MEGHDAARACGQNGWFWELIEITPYIRILEQTDDPRQTSL